MRRTVLMILAGIFILPNLCESYLSMEAKINKGWGESGEGKGANTHKSDSVSMNYDMFTGTIMVSTTAESKEVRVKIYKEGELIYADRDRVEKAAALTYTLTEEERGEYDVCVDVEGGGSLEDTILKE